MLFLKFLMQIIIFCYLYKIKSQVRQICYDRIIFEVNVMCAVNVLYLKLI